MPVNELSVLKRFLLPLIAALALPTACSNNEVSDKTVNAKIDKATAEFCMKASDFAGCVETLTRGLDKKRLKDVDQELRTWTRDDGRIIRMRVNSLSAKKERGSYGRYLEYVYSIETKNGGATWGVQADCKDYTANWDQDNYGWYQVSKPEEYLKPGKEKSMYSPALEAKEVLDEFCPQMDKLVLEAKERDRINGIEEANNKTSSSGLKVNCDSPIWKDKPRCN